MIRFKVLCKVGRLGLLAVLLLRLVANGQAAVSAITEYYPGDDAINPWGLELVRDFNGKLTTYEYAWSGDNFVTTVKTGGGDSPDSTEVTSGTKTVTTVNKAGVVLSWVTTDIQTEVVLDSGTAADQTQIFPGSYTRPLGTTESYTYDGQGQVLTHTDRLGKQTQYTYDALYRVTKVTRAGVTWDIAYNPGHLGRKVTCSSADGTHTTEETTSPFGETQTVTISGVENVTVTRTEDTGSVTTETVNSTTGRNVTQTQTKSTRAETVSGNATEPWNVTYGFTGSGWTETAKHGSVSTTTTYDSAGEVTSVANPSPNATGSVVTSYGYATDKWEVTESDPDGKTTYDYLGNGELAMESRGERHLQVTRTLSGAGIQWVRTNAENETEWKEVYIPSTGETDDYPWEDSGRKQTTLTAISGDEVTLTTNGEGVTQTQKSKDGVPQAGSFTGEGIDQSATAALNTFGEVTEVDTKFGGVTGSSGPTTSYSTLGLPTKISGVAGMADTTFPAVPFDTSGNLNLTASINGHSRNALYSAKGYELKTGGYGSPVVSSTEPNFGGSLVTTSFNVPNASGTDQLLAYSPAGTLKQRNFPDGTSESFTFTAGGALSSWTSPQGTMAFQPNQFGEPTRLGDAVWSIVYDKAGRVKQVSDRSGTHTRSYTQGELSSESHTSGPLIGQSVGRTYLLGRLQKVTLPGGMSYSYTYNADGSLNTVSTAGGAVAQWSDYNATTGRPKSFQVLSGAAAFSTSTGINVLGQVTSHASTAKSGTTSFGYGYNGNGQCSSLSTPDGQWNMDYDVHGFLTSGAGTGQTYYWDAAGRRLGSSSDYMPGSRSNSSQVIVVGSATAGANVTITNGATVTPVSLGTSGAFLQPYAPTPGSWQSYVVSAIMGSAQAEEIRQIFVPPASESLSHDSSGNRTQDSRWTFGWNDLNQLASAVDNNPNGITAISFIYDFQGRMVQRTVTVAGQMKRRTTTLYDGWKPVLQIDYNAQNQETARRTYTWGPDVSGSFDGAAGIGGLVEVVEKRAGMTNRCLTLNDGMGNVVGLVDEGTGDSVATYRFGPFGELLSAYGPRAMACTLRWQTKHYDEDLGLYYFGKRWYDPRSRCFISRDPLREGGGVNLVAYCNNQPFDGHDPVGLDMEVGEADEGPLRQFFGSENVQFKKRFWWNLYRVEVSSQGYRHLAEYLAKTGGDKGYALRLAEAIQSPFYRFTGLEEFNKGGLGKWIGQKFEGYHLEGMPRGSVVTSPDNALGISSVGGYSVPFMPAEYTAENELQAATPLLLTAFFAAIIHDPFVEDLTAVESGATAPMTGYTWNQVFQARYGVANVEWMAPKIASEPLTLGVLRSPAGEFEIASGWNGYGGMMPKGASGFDIVTRTHVEGQAAALMQRQGISEGLLYINNPVICPSCTRLLPSMLGPGRSLEVVPFNGARVPFTGR